VPPREATSEAAALRRWCGGGFFDWASAVARRGLTRTTTRRLTPTPLGGMLDAGRVVDPSRPRGCVRACVCVEAPLSDARARRSILPVLPGGPPPPSPTRKCRLLHQPKAGFCFLFFFASSFFTSTPSTHSFFPSPHWSIREVCMSKVRHNGPRCFSTLAHIPPSATPASHTHKKLFASVCCGAFPSNDPSTIWNHHPNLFLQPPPPINHPFP
jgi:hypothetical protein